MDDKISRQSFLESKRTILFHILSKCQDIESNLQAEAIRIPEIKYGIVVKFIRDPLLRYLCNHCSPGNVIEAWQAFKFIDFTTNLGLKRIKVVLPTALDYRVVINEREDGSYGVQEGSYGWLPELLAAKMNFTPIFLPSSNNGATGLKLKNGTWTGASGDLIYKRADFGVLLLTASRFHFMDYSVPVEHITMTFVTAEPKQFFNWLAVLKPFTVTSYILIALTMSVLTIFFTTEAHFRAQMQANFNNECKTAPKTLIMRDMVQVVSFLIASCLTQSSTIKKHTRFLHSIWLLAAIVLSTAYQSKLFYFMTFPIQSPVPDTFNDLAQSDYELTLWSVGGSSFAYFRKGTSVTHRKIFARITTEGSVVKCLLKSLRPKSACLIYVEVADFIMQTELTDRFGRTLPFRFAPARTFPFYAAVALKKHSILLDAVNRIVLPTVEGNLYERMVMQHVRQARHRFLKSGVRNELSNFCGRECEHDPRLGNLIGVFYFVVGGWVISTVVAAVEVLTRFKNIKTKYDLFRQH